MADRSRARDTEQLRKVLEKTVPAHEFSVRGTERELEQTPIAETPSTDAQQFLLKTRSDPSSMSDMEDSSPAVGFSTTSLVPAELLDEEQQAGPRFDVVGEAGHGGTSHVYTVVDRSLGRTIALKLLRGRAEQKKGVKRRFIHEARVTAMLEHPNIVPVYDIGVTKDDRVYFLMKNVSGVSVGDAVRAARDGHPVPPEFETIDGRLRIMLKVCDALAFAHNRGYIHQDIKPDNIMLGEFGEVLILDWGCALGEKERSRGAAATYGTPAYMSPEQARQEGADERSDVYCLGATLYHMLTLCHPTWSNDPNEFWEMKRKGELSPLPERIRQALPEALLGVTRTAMAPEPAERYESVAAFQNAITDYQAHAESIALAHRASEQLAAAGAHAEYHDYSRITARFEQALEMWSQNRDALDGLTRVKRCHALRALERGDLELADSIAKGESALADVVEKIDLERTRRRRVQRRARRVLYAAVALALALVAVFGYYLVDYFKYLGKWQRLYHVDFTADPDLSGLIFGEGMLTGETEPNALLAGGYPMQSTDFFWARDVRERGDVRVEVVVRWPRVVDGLEIMLNARREDGNIFSYCPAGYACQFGGWRGTVNIISRNAQPGWPDQGNSVGCDLEAGRTYRLWFQRVGEEISLFVDGRRVFHVIEPLPLAGEGLEWVGVRSWTETIVESFTVWRMGAPQKTSPVIAGDMFVRNGQLADAARVYMRIAQDHPGTALAEQALTRAYLAASQVTESDTLRAHIREIMRQSHAGSPYWPLLLQADCLAAWHAGGYEEALELGAQALDRAPHSRVALRMLASRGDTVPVDAIDGVLRLLSRTTDVHGLSLEGTGVSDISPLKGLSLRALDLRSNEISDLSPLRGMPLRLLLITANPVSDLSPLRGMPLTTLDAEDCRITDIGPLAGLPLKSLGLSDNDIEDIRPLAGAPVSRLRLQGNRIASIEVLRGVETLQHLDLDLNPLADISPLQGLSIAQLQINWLPIETVDALAGMTVRELEMRHTRVSDLSPLRELGLTMLIIDDNPVRSLEPLAGLPLTQISVSGCGIDDLSALSGMSLKRISCSRNSIRDIEALRGMPLRQADIADNRVEDLSPLAGAPLQRLDVAGNPLRSLYPFEDSCSGWIVFDTVTGGRRYAERVLSRWERASDTVAARLSGAALAFRRMDGPALRQLASRLGDHRYLYVPVDFTFADAREAAEQVGGYLVTVTNERELRHVHSLLPPDIGVWLGIDVSVEPHRWFTGEPLAYEAYESRYDRISDIPKYHLRSMGGDAAWYAADYADALSDIVIEWDD
ncbi:MAG: protein kinase [Chitinivibrionales bacterium]|nr:protein kinase [Chitinivibrionales bacterium]